jgi:hypothetical protein
MMTDPAFNQADSIRCYNRATISIPGAGLPGDVCGAACESVTDCACVDIRVPCMNCTTTISADYMANGTIDVPAMNCLALSEQIISTQFPIRFRIQYQVTNCGDIPLSGLTICDLELVADAVAAGITGLFTFRAQWWATSAPPIALPPARKLFLQLLVNAADC